MRRLRRGASLMELSVTLTMLLFTMLGIIGLFVSGLGSFDQTRKAVEVSSDNAQGMRFISERLREAVTISITDSGRTITYTLPRMTNSPDSNTGEIEVQYPVASDGVERSFTVANGELTDTESDRVLVRNIASVDPDPESSQYNQAYAPFQLTTIGSYRAVTINLITKQQAAQKEVYARMKTTVLVRNGL
ncbi:MAG TPA: hypothetical protein PKA27_13345 [Fimbriimonadaceae bacterium]|nr:hypothetical protein [Fimbriimonadaceae bacterium]